MSEQNDELLPCPFCGKAVELRLEPSFGSDNATEYWRIYCSCGLGSPDALYDADKKQEIVKDWNTRADISTLKAQCDGMLAALQMALADHMTEAYLHPLRDGTVEAIRCAIANAEKEERCPTTR